MNCPNQEKQILPCKIVQHPSKEHIFFCKVCQESYDVREIGTESSNNPFLVILGVVLVIFGIAVMSSQPSPPTPSLIENSSLDR
ncbi:hypothetical protein [Argonema galeatum]|uniref:hypothetical protein n=1 Tax=Argonema galeatum TaxID=2942762 RepID=UPI0020115DA4|nr:hypothetical protein [Argonema galeatum]MCL1468608.1 hypothetical protein [Argonema galeatum A003/A1]